jgi:hypothetical protein
VKGGWGEEGEREKERALRCDDATAVDIEDNPQRCYFTAVTTKKLCAGGGGG